MKIAVIGPTQPSRIAAERFAREGAYVVQFHSSQIKRVHKRFLGPNEMPEARLKDLFRVVRKMDPTDSELLQTMPMADDLKAELRRSHEGFEDFDLVLEFEDQYQVGGLGPGGSLVLHEDLSPKGLIYGLSELSSPKVQQYSRIALVGEGYLTAQALLELRPWLSVVGHSLTVITPEKSWLKELRTSDSENIIPVVDEFLNELMQTWRARAESFSQELHAWRAELEKGSKQVAPSEPIAPLTLFEGFNVTSIDRLSDRDELYLTIESPFWRGQTQDVIKILSLDCVCGLVPSPQTLGRGLALKEPGFYRLTLNDQHDLETSLEQVWNDVLKYFSRS